jgi:hypothetical protein
MRRSAFAWLLALAGALVPAWGQDDAANWTTERGVLDELDGLGIEPSFRDAALRALVVFGPDGTGPP